jgi:hypothetical protein
MWADGGGAAAVLAYLIMTAGNKMIKGEIE